MPNKTSSSLFSIDLVSAALEHRRFLKAVHTSKNNLYESGPDLDLALSLYFTEWLPCLAKSTNTVPPTLEIAWVWHLHKLDPLAYAKDCQDWFGRIMDMPGTWTPFSISKTNLNTGSRRMVIPTTFTEAANRIIACAQRQSTFLWQVRWPEYEDSEFLRDAVLRYSMMLKLMKNNPDKFIVPTYDIDIIWHTHMSFPAIYQKDCTRHVGRIVSHDDSVNDRSSKSKLSISSEETEQLWLQAFCAPWSKEGAMYRGEPPSWYWDDREAGANNAHAQKECEFEVEMQPATPEKTKKTKPPVPSTTSPETPMGFIIPGYGLFAPVPTIRTPNRRPVVFSEDEAWELPPPPGWKAPNYLRFFAVSHPTPLGALAGYRLMYRLPSSEMVSMIIPRYPSHQGEDTLDSPQKRWDFDPSELPLVSVVDLRRLEGCMCCSCLSFLFPASRARRTPRPQQELQERTMSEEQRRYIAENSKIQGPDMMFMLAVHGGLGGAGCGGAGCTGSAGCGGGSACGGGYVGGSSGGGTGDAGGVFIAGDGGDGGVGDAGLGDMGVGDF